MSDSPTFRAASWLCFMLARDGRHLPMALGETWEAALAAGRHQLAGVGPGTRARMVERFRFAPLDADAASEMAEWFAADPAAAVWCRWDGAHVGPSYGPGGCWEG